MKKVKLVLWMVLALCVIICISFLYLTQKEPKVPEEVYNTIEIYMAAYKQGTTKSIDYIHFENNFTREAYLDSGIVLVDYHIENIEQINENLYALTVLSKTNISDGKYVRVYNFVAKIDNDWLYINGVNNIPAELRDGLDAEKYSYRSK